MDRRENPSNWHDRKSLRRGNNGERNAGNTAGLFGFWHKGKGQLEALSRDCRCRRRDLDGLRFQPKSVKEIKEKSKS